MSEKEILSNKCPYCGSNHVEYITRVTGYFSKVNGWNKGKMAELRDRRSAIEANRTMLSDIKEEEYKEDKRIKFFWKKGCTKCPEAKILSKKLIENGYNVEDFDVETIEGLAESSMYMVMSTPTFIITENGEELKAWRGNIPEIIEIEGAIA